VVPDRLACLEAVTRTWQRLAAAVRRELRGCEARLDSSGRRLKLVHPGVRLLQQMQRLDDLMQRLAGAVRTGLHRDGRRLAESRARLQHYSPGHTLAAWGERNQALQLRLTRAIGERLARAASRNQELHTRLDRAASERVARAAHRLALVQRALDTVSPLATLSRGFAIVTRGDGTLLTDASAAAIGEEIEARLAQGTLTARVTGRK
jgi:exodeoxyribonuclease VII large subunit